MVVKKNLNLLIVLISYSACSVNLQGFSFSQKKESVAQQPSVAEKVSLNDWLKNSENEPIASMPNLHAIANAQKNDFKQEYMNLSLLWQADTANNFNLALESCKQRTERASKYALIHTIATDAFAILSLSAFIRAHDTRLLSDRSSIVFGLVGALFIGTAIYSFKIAAHGKQAVLDLQQHQAAITSLARHVGVKITANKNS